MSYTSTLTFIGSAIGPTGQLSIPSAIEVESVSFGIENLTTIGSQTGGAGAGKAQFNEFIVTKNIDGSSPTLFVACGLGAHFPEVQLAILPVSGQAPSIVYTFKLVFITKIDTAGNQHAGSAPLEQVTFVYGAMQVQTQGQANGSQGNTGAWSQITNQPNLNVS